MKTRIEKIGSSFYPQYKNSLFWFCFKDYCWAGFYEIKFDTYEKAEEFLKEKCEVENNLISETRTEIGVEEIDLTKLKRIETRQWVEVKINGRWVMPRDYIQIIFDNRQGYAPILNPTVEQLERYESIRLVQCTYHPEKDGVMVQQYVGEAD